MRPRIGKYIGGIAIAFLCAGRAVAFDGIAAESGVSSEDSIGVFRVNAQWSWERRWFTAGDWFLGGHWEFDAGYWDGQDGRTANASLTEIGITPVFRLKRHQPFASGLRPYVEFAIGAHLLSDDTIDNRELGGSFQFGDHVGLGAEFGPARRFDLGLRLQHLSNGGLEASNDGINFFIARLGYRF